MAPLPGADVRDRQTTRNLWCLRFDAINCVVDGDTIWLSGVKIRMADYDTPEIGEPKCAAERRSDRKRNSGWSIG